jgi:hypothetical protein
MIRHRQVREAASIAAPGNSAGAVLLTWYRGCPRYHAADLHWIHNAWFGLAYAGSGEISNAAHKAGRRAFSRTCSR